MTLTFSKLSYKGRQPFPSAVISWVRSFCVYLGWTIRVKWRASCNTPRNHLVTRKREQQRTQLPSCGYFDVILTASIVDGNYFERLVEYSVKKQREYIAHFSFIPIVKTNLHPIQGGDFSFQGIWVKGVLLWYYSRNAVTTFKVTADRLL